MQFTLIVITFFVLSLNAVAAPQSADLALLNPLIKYDPQYLAEASEDITPYVPILATLDQKEVKDQVLSAAIGTETAYVPTPMLVETIDHQTANRIRRGLRKEVVTHTINQGETLSKIAQQYGINVATLLEDNNINVADINKIKPGTKLTIAPETKTQSIAWLDQLHEEERKAREVKEKERLAKLAKSNKGRISVAKASSDGSDNSENQGRRFGRPIGNSCRNGYHTYAVDCMASVGTSILAAATGTVTHADANGYNGGYGKNIRIQHANGWSTLYAHLNTVNVSAGDQVSAGDVIAGAGNTGRSTGPHLHFEVHNGGQRLNPCRGYISC